MNTILHNQQLGVLRGFLIALLLALCLPPASAQDSVAGTMEGDSVFATVKGVTLHFYNHGHDSLTIDNVYGTADTLDIPAYVTVGDSTYKVTAVPEGTNNHHLGGKKFKVLILPETLYGYSNNSFAHWFHLERVISKRVEPVSTWNTLFNSHSDYVWRTSSSLSIYNAATLQIPFGSKPRYGNCTPWRYFAKVEEGLEPTLGYACPELTADSTDYDSANGIFTSTVRVTITNPNTSGDIYYYTVNENKTLRTSDILKYEGAVELSETSGIVAYVTDGTARSQTSEAHFKIQANAIYVQGRHVTQDNMYDVLGDKGSVALDPKTGALVLTNANVNPYGESETGIMAYGDDLTIQLNGNSTVTGGSQGIEFNYGYGRMASPKGPTLTIEGQNNGTDTLTVNVNGKPINAVMVYLANLTIRNCVVIVNGADGEVGIYYKAGDGKIDGTLTVDNATLQASGGGSAITGVYNLNLSDSVSIIYPEGASFVSSMMSKGEGANIIDSTGTTSPTVIIGKATASDTTAVAQDKALTSTFSRVAFHGLCIADETTDSLELNWTANALYDYGNRRPTLVQASGVPTTLQSRYNITGTLDSITLNIDGQYASSTITATTNGGKKIGSVTIDAKDSSYNATGSNLFVIKPDTPVTMDDESIILTANFESYRIGVNSVAVNYTGEARTVDWFRHYYNIFIDGMQLNSDMLSVNIPFEEGDTGMNFGATGGITFNPDSLVLTLDNAVIANYSGRVISATNTTSGVVGYDIPNLKMRLIGTSEISGGDGGFNWRSNWHTSPASDDTGALNPIYNPAPNDANPNDVEVTARPYSVTLYSEDGNGFIKTLGVSPDSINVASTMQESFISTDSLIIDSCKVFFNRIEAAALDMHNSSTLYTAWFNVNRHCFDDNIGILAPESAYFDDNGKLQGYNFYTDSCLLVIGPKQAIEIEPVQTDTTTAVSLIDASNFTNDNGGQVNLNNTVIANVYYSINNSGDDTTQTGYYDTSDNSIVVTATTETSTVNDIAAAEDPLAAAATSNYTGLIFQVPAGQGTITLETQTYGSTAVAVQVGTEAPQVFTASTQAEKTANYTATKDTYVYIYTVSTASAAKSMGAKVAPTNGAKIFSVKVKEGAIATGINGVKAFNDSQNADGVDNSSVSIYNLAGQRVDRSYKGIVIKNGKKRIVR